MNRFCDTSKDKFLVVVEKINYRICLGKCHKTMSLSKDSCPWFETLLCQVRDVKNSQKQSKQKDDKV